jgi:UDP-N-acetylmuramate--alanine ligase
MKFYPLNIKHIYMLGIGGIGMSALARYFNALGVQVSGYDKTSTPLTDQLAEEGIDIHFTDDPKKIPAELDLCIYTPAIPRTLKEFNHFAGTSVPVKKRAAVLGEVTKQHRTVAVSGTHGKTTVSTMIAHILHNSTLGCSAFLGGIAKNYNSNFLYSETSRFMVVEADEFDRSFLQLKPAYTVVTSMDADHLDIYASHDNLKDTFREFISQTVAGGSILLKKGIELNYKPSETTIYSYSLEEDADFHATAMRTADHRYTFDLVTPDGALEGITLQMPGLINVENAVAAAAIAHLCGVSGEEIRLALAQFTGIKRRFDVQLNTGKLLYIDDYAHHPEEIRSFVNSVRTLYPDRTVLGVFQPHLYSRTRDFAGEFAKSLELLDEVVLLPLYPAREEPIEGVDSEMILDRINIKKKKVLPRAELIGYLEARAPDILLTIGAGDIDQLVEPIKKALSNPDKS